MGQVVINALNQFSYAVVLAFWSFDYVSDSEYKLQLIIHVVMLQSITMSD